MNDLSAQSGLISSVCPKPRVAILVDGDNVPHSALPEIEVRAASLGNPILRRVYADMGLRKDWAAETDYLATHCTTSSGKNRADIQLVIGAMDIAHRGLATHFLILSDDRDFGPLVAHLREIGMTVEWAGKPKPVQKLIIATAVVVKPTAISDLDHKLHAHLRSVKTRQTIQAIGCQMRYGTVKAQTGKATWRSYLQSKPEFYLLSGEGKLTVVTLKNP